MHEFHLKNEGMTGESDSDKYREVVERRFSHCLTYTISYIGLWSGVITVLDDKDKMALKKNVEDIDANVLLKNLMTRYLSFKEFQNAPM